MKNTFILILITVLFVSCRKHNPDIKKDDDFFSSVVIRGTIPGERKDDDSVSLADARHVLIFSGTTFSDKREYKLLNIEDRSFSSKVNPGPGVARVYEKVCLT